MTGTPQLIFEKSDIKQTTITIPQKETKLEIERTYYIYVYATTELTELTGPASDPFELITSEADLYVDPDFNQYAAQAGDPINLVSGNFSYHNVDLQVGNNNTGLSFKSFYYSNNAVKSRYEDKNDLDNKHPELVLGTGWSHTYMCSLKVNRSTVTIYLGDGSFEIYKIKYLTRPVVVGAPQKVITGFKNKSNNVGSKLNYDDKTSQYTLTKKDQTKYVFTAQDGLLIKIISPISNETILKYDKDNLLKSVEAVNLPYKLLFAYTKNKLTSITDNYERQIQYDFTEDELTEYIDVLDKNRRFTYTDKTLMETAQDQNGDIFVYNKYKEYDVSGFFSKRDIIYRVIFQQDADAYANAPKSEEYGIRIDYADYKVGFSIPFLLRKKKRLKSTVTNVSPLPEDPNKRVTIYDSDQSGNLLRETIALDGNNTSLKLYDYNGFGARVSESKFIGKVKITQNAVTSPKTSEMKTVYTSYDRNLNIVAKALTPVVPFKEQDNIEEFTYNAKNQIKTHTDQLGNVTKYQYDDMNLIKITNALGEVEVKYDYHPGEVKGLVKGYTDKLGNIFSYDYEHDNLKETLDPYGNKVKIEAYKYWLPSVVHDIDAAATKVKTTKYKYNDMGVKISESLSYLGQTDACAFLTIFTVDNIGQVTQVTNPKGDVTKYEYSPNMNLVLTTYPEVDGLSIKENRAYDMSNNLIKVQVDDSVTCYQYNALDQLVKTIDPNGNVYQYSYELSKETTSKTCYFPQIDTDDIVNETTVFDQFERPVTTVNRAGVKTNISYSNEGGKLTVTTVYPEVEGGSYQTQETKDELGRISTFIDQQGNKTNYAYQIKDQLLITTKTDPLGIETISKTNAHSKITFNKTGDAEESFSYDCLNRITAIEQKINETKTIESTYEYDYDDAANTIETKITQGGILQSILYHNGMNQLVISENATGQKTQREFNARGQLAKYLIQNGHEINYEFNNIGLNNKIVFADDTHTDKEFDFNGNCVKTEHFEGETIVSSEEMTMDEWDRLTDLSRNNGVISYEYDVSNNLTRLTYPLQDGEVSRVSVDYAFNDLGQMKKVTDWHGRETHYDYTATSAISKTLFSNGTACEYRYDEAHRLTKLVNLNNDVLISLYNATSINDNGHPIDVQRLESLIPNSKSAINDFEYNENNQLKSFNAADISYDVNGNPANLPKMGNMPAVDRIKYNDMNLITEYGDDRYSYDASGLRVKSIINGNTTHYITSPNAYAAPYLSMLNPLDSQDVDRCAKQLSPLDQILQTTDENNQLQKRFIYGANGVLIAEENAADEYRVYHLDEVQSTIALSCEKGVITDRYVYAPYGKLLRHVGENDTPFQYNGGLGVLTDANGLTNMRSRSYRTEMMRFLQPDFLLGSAYSPQSLNRYAYVGGDPIGFIDPLGLERGNSQVLGVQAGIYTGVVIFAGGMISIGYGAYKIRQEGMKDIGDFFVTMGLGLMIAGALVFLISDIIWLTQRKSSNQRRKVKSQLTDALNYSKDVAAHLVE
jgi:RHS repeat-associated protein